MRQLKQIDLMSVFNFSRFSEVDAVDRSNQNRFHMSFSRHYSRFLFANLRFVVLLSGHFSATKRACEVGFIEGPSLSDHIVATRRNGALYSCVKVIEHSRSYHKALMYLVASCILSGKFLRTLSRDLVLRLTGIVSS